MEWLHQPIPALLQRTFQTSPLYPASDLSVGVSRDGDFTSIVLKATKDLIDIWHKDLTTLWDEALFQDASRLARERRWCLQLGTLPSPGPLPVDESWRIEICPDPRRMDTRVLVAHPEPTQWILTVALPLNHCLDWRHHFPNLHRAGLALRGPQGQRHHSNGELFLFSASTL